ncbi:MAG TPA: serine hydrolase domain-containing protein [Leadbetterella sp.]|nr:serine hydrolase domain-containing protein [Leadbetterella sp.]
MSNCDVLVQNFMSSFQIPGMSIAISKNGKLVYNRSFGNSNISGTESTYPHNLFRIASISKPITAIAIMKLYENGQLGLDDKVFGSGGILENHVFLKNANISDTRINNITVRHLLEHTAGWNRDISCFPNPTTPYPWFFGGCDPIAAPMHVASSNGRPNPATEEDMIYFLLQKGLDFTPGTAYSYSNIGYLVLGEVIELKSGLSYENYVKSQILDPIGAHDMFLGKNLLTNKMEREVEYKGNGYVTLDCYGNGNYVPWEYGGFNLEAMDAHGGWVATPRDLLRLITAVDGFPSVPDILSPSTITQMVTPSTVFSNYAKGWSVNSGNNWWHTGALDGTATFAARTYHGYTWAVFLNKRIIDSNANNFWNALDGLPWNCIANVSNWPTHDLFKTPSIPATEITFETISNSSCKVKWTNGNGTKRVLVGRASSPINKFPVDGISYAANTSFGQGTNLGNNNIVLFDDTQNEAIITDLQNGIKYYFRVFEYNQNAETGNYKLYHLAKSNSFEYLNGCNSSLNLNQINQSVYKTNGAIVSNATLPNYTVRFQAANHIELSPGFKSSQGNVFLASLDGCN